MKQIKKLLLVSFLAVMIVLPFVAAATFQDTVKLITGVDMTKSAPDIIVRIVVFLILLVTFGDILYGFSPFNQVTCWIIGGGLAIIAAVTGGIAAIAAFFFDIGAFIGVLGVGSSIVLAFLAFLMITFGFGGLAGWLRRNKEKMQAETGMQRLGIGTKALAEEGKRIIIAGG